jgi:hypothetical protein
MPSLAPTDPRTCPGVFRRGADEWEIVTNGGNLGGVSFGHFKLSRLQLPGDGPYQPPIALQSAPSRSAVNFA